MHIPVKLFLGTNSLVDTHALIDCGAGGTFIDQNYARRNHIPMKPLTKPIPVFNVDGTPNKQGTIRHFASLNITIGNRTNRLNFFVCGLRKQSVILGLPWLKRNNPDIDWAKGTLTWRTPMFSDPKTPSTAKASPVINQVLLAPETPRVKPLTICRVLCTFEDELDEEGNPTSLWINAKVTASQLFAHADFTKKVQKPIEEIVPKKFHKFLHLFKEETAAKFLPSRPFDHEIKLKEGFEPKVFKTYTLALAEQLELDKFLEENLRLGRI